MTTTWRVEEGGGGETVHYQIDRLIDRGSAIAAVQFSTDLEGRSSQAVSPQPDGGVKRPV